tara:strand:+ start:18713 stop:19942 length:1230 start_codon:yes stop_codon:yes gene_type:complete
MFDLLLYNANILCFSENYSDFHVINNGVIGIKDEIIELISDSLEDNLDLETLINNSIKVIDIHNKWVLPGFIDCHTHFIYGGNRSHEFEQILEGLSYKQIAEQGGGIKYTVAQTRKIAYQDLLNISEKRLNNFIYNNGVTTVEVKSGYGLDLDTEIKMLKVAKKLSEISKIDVIKTYLGAHVTPIEYQGNNDKYIDFIINEVLPELIKLNLIDSVDAFCENIAFDKNQVERLFKSASTYNLKLKCHAEQLSNSGVSNLLNKYQILSLEHLEYANLEDIKNMANNKTTAVLLPGAFYYLKEIQKPPIDLFRQYKVPIAIATDCNPGSSPCESLLVIMNMACVLYKLTIFEVIKAVTINAAKALGLDKTIGSIEKGKQADLVIWNIDGIQDLCYKIGAYRPEIIIKKGILI